MKTIRIQKGHLLQSEGTLNSKIYLVTSGLLRSYILDAKGKEHIFMFGPEGWVVADSNSADQPSMLYIDALEDSVVEVREKKDLKNSPRVVPLLKRISVLQERVLMLMSASAIERYEHFMRTYPNISQRVPQKMIASYLGITPEALSKLKREKLKKSEVGPRIKS